MNYNNKTVLVTGGTSGIGKATAKEFADLGARVIITGRSQDRLDAAISQIGGDAVGILVDQGDMSQVNNISDKVSAITDTLDAVFLNAGSGDFTPIGAIDEDTFDWQYNVLVKGNFFTAQALVPLIKEGGSLIFNISVVTEMGMQGGLVYSSAKGAVLSMLKTFAAELAPKGIRVNAVSPGPIETEFFGKTSLPEDQIAGMAEGIVQSVPLKRFGKAEDIAHAVTFLASDHASYIHGVNLPVDGGMTQF